MAYFLEVPPGEEEPLPLSEVEDTGCLCKKPDWTLGIDAGSVMVACRTCKQGPPSSWWDWIESLHMDDIPITLEWKKEPCMCSTSPDRLSCDCDAYLIATPVMGAVEGEKKK